MIPIQDLLRVVDVDLILRRDAPRQFADDLEIGADHTIFRRGRRNSFQPRQLARRLFHHRLGRIGRLQLFTQLIHLGGRPLVRFSQLLANRLELLLQIKPPLALVDVLGDLLLNLGLKLQNVELRRQPRSHHAQSLLDIQLLQHRLLLGHVRLKIRR